MLKLIGILAASSAAAALGFMESHKLSLRVAELEKFQSFLVLVRTEIRYSALPVQELMARCGTELALWGPCMESLRSGESFAVSWGKGLQSVRGRGLTEKDRDLMRRFGRELGATDVEGQLSHCDLFGELIRAELSQARDEKEKKSRLYQMMGISAGLTLALLLW